MRFPLVLTLLCLGGPLCAEGIVAARTLPARTILAAGDLHAEGSSRAAMQALLGQETRATIYAGRPVRPADVAPPALVDRNQIVELVYRRGGLNITAEARALGRGAVGDRIRVMNLGSRSAVFGRVLADGRVDVSR